MKTILHPDYWIEIPAGKYLTGLSETQCELIRSRLYRWADYDQLPVEDRRLTENLIKKYKQRAKSIRAGRIKFNTPLKLTREERALQESEPFSMIIGVESVLSGCPQRQIWLDRFYISRFPVTTWQYKTRSDGRPAAQLPGVLETDRRRKVAAVSTEGALWLCQELGVRLPTVLEWEKAARGPEGYLYPWGDDWNPEAGHFYYGQPTGQGRQVDAYPQGASPYGVEFMAGGLPELALSLGSTPQIVRMGCHARRSSAETAWIDHMLIHHKGGGWISLRPAMSRWPRQQWSGFWTVPKTLQEKPLISRLPVGIPTIKLKSITAGNGPLLKPVTQLKNDEAAAHDAPKITYDLAWSARGKKIALINHWSELWLYQADTKPFPHHRIDNLGDCAAFSPDGQLLALGYQDCTVRLWEIMTQTDILALETKDQPCTLAFSADQKRLAAADRQGTICLWNIERKEVHTIATEHPGWVTNVIFSPDNRWLASAGEDKTVRLWDVSTGQTVSTFTKGVGPVYDVVFSPDSSILGSANGDGTVSLWNIQSGSEQQVLRDPNHNIIVSLTIHPTGKLLVTGQTNGTFTIWDLRTGEIAAVIPCYGPWIEKAWVVKVAFDPTGAMLATYNQGAVIWGLPDEA